MLGHLAVAIGCCCGFAIGCGLFCRALSRFEFAISRRQRRRPGNGCRLVLCDRLLRRSTRSDRSVRSDRSIASDRSDRSVRSDEEQEDQDEQATLESYLALIDQEAAASAKIKAAQSALITKVAAQYGKLTESEIKTLVVDDKWLARLAADVQSELDRVSQSLTGRVRQLAERYASPLPSLTEQVESLSARVAEHLKKMGAVWN